MSRMQREYDAAYCTDPARYELESEQRAREDYIAELLAEHADPYAHEEDETNWEEFYAAQSVVEQARMDRLAAAVPDEDIPF